MLIFWHVIEFPDLASSVIARPARCDKMGWEYVVDSDRGDDDHDGAAHGEAACETLHTPGCSLWGDPETLRP